MPLPKDDAYTIEDIYALPDGQRAELIDGQIYNMAPPSTRHQEILSELHYAIKDYIKKKKGFCRVYPAPFAVRLSENDKAYVEPDISVICDMNKLDDTGCNGAPDWIVDSVKGKIAVYNFESEDGGEYTFSDVVKVGIYDDLLIDFSQIT